MLPDLLPTAEVLAKGVKHVAAYVADAIAERRKAFDDDEAGDYLRCAGTDALAESLTSASADFPTAESDDPAEVSSPLTSAGSPLSDSALFLTAAVWIETEARNRLRFLPDDSAFYPSTNQLVAQLQDRAAQFAAIEADADHPFAPIRFPFIDHPK